MYEPGLDRHDWESVDANDEARREFDAAHEITQLVERGDDVSPGDVAAAINGYRAVFDYVATLGLPAES